MACGLFHLMEDFILREVDYSQKYGYSSRAKRYMKRKLNKELAPFIEDVDDEIEDELVDDTKETIEGDGSLNESSSNEGEDFETYYESLNNFDSILIPKNRVEICFFLSYLSIILTFYGVSAYIMTNYSNHSNECKSS